MLPSSPLKLATTLLSVKRTMLDRAVPLASLKLWNVGLVVRPLSERGTPTRALCQSMTPARLDWTATAPSASWERRRRALEKSIVLES